MIQELLGGGGLLDERKISIPGGLCVNGSSASASPSSTSSSATSSPSSSSSEQNLRCPRCDSSNTKFCYYNNYNLTQPRHFCKTCRRYWTKGGALRNVPIGGGCRKTKNTSTVSVGTVKSGGGKAKPSSSELGRSNLGGGYDQELQANPILWATPQNSHLLALLRATQSSNTNPSATPNLLNPNSARIKDEGAVIGSHLMPDSALMTGALNARNLGLDPLGQIPMSLCSSLWRNSQYQQQQQQQQHHNMMMGEVPSSGIQELYQKLRSPANYYTDHSQMVLGNMVSSSSSISSSAAVATTGSNATSTNASMIMEQSPVAGGEFGYWNLPFSWSDMPTTNGAFP